MKIEIELTEAEIKEAVLGIIANDYAKRLDAERSTVKYVTRKEIKEVIRELLRERMDEYAETGKQIKASSHGGVANLLKTLTKTMELQNASIQSIAKVQYTVCMQAGIYIPDEFITDVSTAVYELNVDGR